MSNRTDQRPKRSPAVSTGGGCARISQEDLPTTQFASGLDLLGNKAQTTDTEFVAADGKTYSTTNQVEPGEKYVTEGGVEYILSPSGRRAWSSKPLFDDQYKKPFELRRDPMRTRVYNLSDEKDLEEFNELQSKLSPFGPGIEIIERERQFYQGTFYMLVSYNRVWYRIPK